MIFRRDTIPNFLAALGRVIRRILRREPFVVPAEAQDARLAQCNACEFLVPDSRQCVKCTCFVDVKTLLSTESCPERKWGRLY
jgi:hypothetical protein